MLFGLGAGDAAQAAPAHLEQSALASSLLRGTFEQDLETGRITADQVATVAAEGVVGGGQHIDAWAAKGESHAQVAAEVRAEIQATGPSTAHAVENEAVQRTLASPDGRPVTKAEVIAQGDPGGIAESKAFWSGHEYYIPSKYMKTLIAVGAAVYLGTVCITLDLSKLSCVALGILVAGCAEYIKDGPCGEGYCFDFPKTWKSHCAD
ncbi:hypothetical protein [Clavibacter michiganensis]|uniref:Uncharacterized protein n=1 Tax=Clavibacter michiganensis TaxID=28447 RepID=A0A251YJY2_9MICO|nr:hypothetical protein [Clavibacter michiganensis]OUE24453.1 hypothetical protein BFL37_11105 [Clavibacter michiganensis]